MDQIRPSAKPKTSAEKNPTQQGKSSSAVPALLLGQPFLTATPWLCHLTDPNKTLLPEMGMGSSFSVPTRENPWKNLQPLPQLGPQQQSFTWRHHFPSPPWPPSMLWMNIQKVDGKSWFGDRTKGNGFLDPGFDK